MSLGARLSASLQRAWWQSRPGLLAQVLRPLSWLYIALAGVDRWRWQRRATASLPVPVVVVGNLIVGGAGKTPTTLALLQALQARGWQPGVVSRGYGRQAIGPCAVSRSTPATDCGDEPLLIHLRSGVPVQVGSDRAEAARLLLARDPAINIIVSDDGLQHWRLHRDLQVIVFDDRGAGNGLCLPAGPLRQPLPAKLPPNSLVLYNARAASTALPGPVAARTLAGAVRLSDWWAGRPADMAQLNQLAEASNQQSVLAAAGLADPERFFRMLEAAGVCLRRLPLPDHAELPGAPWPADEADVLITEKDAVKLRPGQPGTTGPTRIWVVALDFALPDVFSQALDRALQPFPRARHDH